MSIEAMQRWLECAERCESLDGKYSWEDVIFTIKEAIEQAQKQEPVAFRTVSRITKAVGYWPDRVPDYIDADSWEITPLYTSPPQRQWVGLTDEELAVLHDEIKVRLMGTYRTEDIYRAIEAKLKEKNT